MNRPAKAKFLAAPKASQKSYGVRTGVPKLPPVAHGTFFATKPRRHKEKGNAEQELRELTEETLLSFHSVSSVGHEPA